MLHSLRIRNYALIDDVSIEFRHGLNVLTGETGAGKSIIVGALNLILGARASSDAVRAGVKQAEVEAIFSIETPSTNLAARLEEHDIELEDGELLISRTVTAAGRSRAYVGGRGVPLSVLSSIGDELVDMHGQHEHQSLLHTARQQNLLDAFAGINSEVEMLTQSVQKLRAAETQVSELENADREQERRIDFMRFEVDEIEKAQLESEEEVVELKRTQSRAQHAETISQLTQRAVQALTDTPDETSALDRMGTAEQGVAELANIDEKFAALSDRLARAREEISDIAAELNTDEDLLELSPHEIDELHARIELIASLKRKYGDTVDAVLAYRDGLVAELDQFDNRDAHLESLRQEAARLLDDAMRQAKSISKKRAKAARKLESTITATLEHLGMSGAAFTVSMESGDLTSRGTDKIEFTLAANTGEAAKPLRQVASGGETSRVMLAIKTAFAESDAIPTLIFDEIDAGVGGAVANQVADRLRALSASHQVLCITHLPQIAAAGFAHFHVSKSVQDERTTTSVDEVSDENRVRELARLLDGSVTDISIKHAETLLKDVAS